MSAGIRRCWRAEHEAAPRRCAWPRALVRALLVPALASGCDIVEPSAEDAASDLERARSRWEAAGIGDYTLTVERFCFCAPVGPVRVFVEDGVAVAAVPEDPSVVGVKLADYPAVEGLFDLVESALRRRAHHLTVVYHPTLGYPTGIDIDYRESVDDEEVRLEIALRLGRDGPMPP